MGLPEPDTYKYDTINLVGSDVRDFEPLYPLTRDGSLTRVDMPCGRTFFNPSFDDLRHYYCVIPRRNRINARRRRVRPRF